MLERTGIVLVLVLLVAEVLARYGYTTDLQTTDELLQLLAMFASQQARSSRPPVVMIDNADRMLPSTLAALGIPLSALQQVVGISNVNLPGGALRGRDSQYLVRGMTDWVHGWARKGWKRKGEPLKNLDLVKPLLALYRAHPECELVWIAAHSGNRWNEYADSLSTAWMRDEL